MKFVLFAAALATAVAAQNATLSTCQQTCVDSQLATNPSCGTTYEVCACDNSFVQAVKVCLYKGSCSSDVATWFEVASDGCDADGGTASYSASHASDYVFSTAAAAAETSAVSVSSAAASATPSGGAMSNAPQLGAIAAVVGALLL